MSCGQDVSKEISNLKEFLIQQGKEIVKIKQENKVTRIGIFKQNVWFQILESLDFELATLICTSWLVGLVGLVGGMTGLHGVVPGSRLYTAFLKINYIYRLKWIQSQERSGFVRPEKRSDEWKQRLKRFPQNVYEFHRVFKSKSMTLRRNYLISCRNSRFIFLYCHIGTYMVSTEIESKMRKKK